MCCQLAIYCSKRAAHPLTRGIGASTMPVTPRFSVRQDDEFVLVDIVVPFVRVSDMEFVIDGCEFSFYCKPFLLKLTFPHELVEDDRTKAVYDPAKVRWRSPAAALRTAHVADAAPRRTMGRSRSTFPSRHRASIFQTWNSSRNSCSPVALPRELRVRNASRAQSSPTVAHARTPVRQRPRLASLCFRPRSLSKQVCGTMLCACSGCPSAALRRERRGVGQR